MIAAKRSRCAHIVSWDGVAPVYCNKPGLIARLKCPANRPDAQGSPYCDEHGGKARSLVDAKRDWNFLAPESVGDAEQVYTAGSECLRTVDAYVVVRPEHGRWLAWLGLGSMLTQVAAPETTHLPCLPKGKRPGKRERARYRSYRFASQEEAIAAATAESNARREQHVAEIRMARGGTLSWGLPVAPLASPVVIVAPEHGSAWDLLPHRRSPAGLCVFSGLRPSGEAA